MNFNKKILMPSFKILIVVLLLLQGILVCSQTNVGYRVGAVKSYKLLKKEAKSALYQIQSPQLDDGRPIKLLDLHGSRQEVGYAYGVLLGKEISQTYKKFFHSEVSSLWELKLIETFLDWQYEAYLKKQIPKQYKDELNGIQKGGKKMGYHKLKLFFERVLVVSSFPGDLGHDIAAVLLDEFLRNLQIKNPKFMLEVQTRIIYAIRTITHFINKKRLHCSFFAVWGSRTQNRDLYTMRNLDWAANTGVNENKLIIVWNIDGKIPAATLGFPGVLGAITGMSAKGLTVHQAGMSSLIQTQTGIHWTLRMRKVMQNANNLAEAKEIWMNTKNSLGMNFMIASASDAKGGKPALVMETMRDYTAFFKDYDPRQDGTIFKDPKTGKDFQAGFSMPQAVFRTNHAYDSKIRKYARSNITLNDDSMIRYRILKNSFIQHKNNKILIGQKQALNITAVLGDKGSEQFLTCPSKHIGINVISVMYKPSQLKMWAGFEYGFQKTFRSACCGVYVQIDMKNWFNKKDSQERLKKIQQLSNFSESAINRVSNEKSAQEQIIQQ